MRNSQISEAVAGFLQRALELDPDARFSSAEAMQEALATLLEPASPREIAAWVEALLQRTAEAGVEESPDATRPNRSLR